MSKRRTVTVAIHHEGDPESKVFRLPEWLFRSMVTGSVVFVALVVLAAILYTPVVRTAARVPSLNRDIARLSSENAQVRELAATLAQLEARYAQVRSVLGAEVLPAEARDDLPTSVPIVALMPDAPATFEEGPTLPVYWPLDSASQGVVTRGFAPAGAGGEEHTGIDIAVSRGTPIRAAGGGRVLRSGFDREYGLFVLLQHPDGYQSMYGHASRVLVVAGDSVRAGEVIALVGTTGRSTAPHLHFEKRKDDVLIDPRTLLEGS